MYWLTSFAFVALIVSPLAVADDVCDDVDVTLQRCITAAMPGRGSNYTVVVYEIPQLLASDDNTALCSKYKDVNYPEVNKCFMATNVSDCMPPPEKPLGGEPFNVGPPDNPNPRGPNPFTAIEEICTTDCSNLKTRMAKMNECYESFPEVQSFVDKTSFNATECGQLETFLKCEGDVAGTCAFIVRNLLILFNTLPNSQRIFESCNLTTPNFLTTTDAPFTGSTVAPTNGSWSLAGTLVGSIFFVWMALHNMY